MVPAFLDDLDNLPGDGGIVPSWIRVTGEAQVDQFPGDTLPFQLLFQGIHDSGTRLHMGMEFLSIPVQHIRCEAVIAAVRTPGIDVDGVISVFLSFSFRHI